MSTGQVALVTGAGRGIGAAVARALAADGATVYAAAIAYLCSPRAGFMNGQVLSVDGGVYR